MAALALADCMVDVVVAHGRAGVPSQEYIIPVFALEVYYDRVKCIGACFRFTYWKSRVAG